METGKFRKKKIYFTQVSNTALRDTNLSLKAKGLYALINSYITLEDFTLYKTTLLKNCAEGKKAFDAAWKELKDAGYLIQYRLQGEKGKFYYEYELLDEPQSTEMAEISQSIHIPKKEVVDNGGSGKRVTAKRGIYNNTNLNNTDLNNTNINNISSSKEEAGEKKEEDNTFNKDLKTLMSFCNNVNYKLNKEKEKTILQAFGLNKVIKAITTIVSTVDTNNIKNYAGYLTATLKDMETTKNITIENKIEPTTNNNTKQSNFANFTQRQYDYDKLERQLLGWETPVEETEESMPDTEVVEVETEIADTESNTDLFSFLEDKIAEVALKTWIMPNFRVNAKEIILTTTDTFIKNIIAKRYLEFIQEFASKTGKTVVMG